jgi:predicted P-loop ATPase
MSTAEIAAVPDWLCERLAQIRHDPEPKPQPERPRDRPSIAKLRAALAAIPADDYETWYKIAAAVKRELPGDDGWQLFREWSAKSSKFNESECREKWSQVSDIADISAGTIFHLATEADPTWLARYRRRGLPPPPEWRDIRDKHGNPARSLANAVIAVKALGIGCRQDLFHHKLLIDYNGDTVDLPSELSDDAIGAVRSLINNMFLLDVGDANVLAAMKEIARDNAFDPVFDYLADVESQWDGVERIGNWLVTYCKAKDTPFNRAVGRKHLVASVRRARQPGVKYDDILVLESPEGRNKSTAIELLAGKENFSDQTILGLDDKVAQEQLAGVWLYEIADLTGKSRADVNKVKAFASRTTDRARPAYGRVAECRPRRCTLWGTTNDEHYLLSQTGNRRFLPVKVGRINIQALSRDRDQLWAEAARAETAGEAIMLDESLWSAAGELQEERRKIDPWEDKLANIPNAVFGENYRGQKWAIEIVHRTPGEERVASQDLLTHVLGVPLSQQNTNHWERLKTVMTRHGWEYKLLRIEDRPTRGYRRAGWRWRNGVAGVAPLLERRHLRVLVADRSGRARSPRRHKRVRPDGPQQARVPPGVPAEQLRRTASRRSRGSPLLVAGLRLPGPQRCSDRGRQGLLRPALAGV